MLASEKRYAEAEVHLQAAQCGFEDLLERHLLAFADHGAESSDYLLCFGTGSVVAMGTLASLVGWIAARPGASEAGTQRALLGLCSLIAVAVGGFWVLSSLPA